MNRKAEKRGRRKKEGAAAAGLDRQDIKAWEAADEIQGFVL